jgi:hypothetical protein
MPRVDPETFAERETAPVFIAATLAEARQAETLLTQRGVDYIVQVEELGSTLFGSPRVGATFYVEASQAAYCGSHLAAAGLGIGVLTGDGSEP